MYDQGSFQVPQEYQRSVVNRLNEDIQRIGTAIVQLEDFIECNQILVMKTTLSCRSMITQISMKWWILIWRTNYKDCRIWVTFCFCCSRRFDTCRLRVNIIQNIVDSLRTKKFEKLYPEKAKKMEFRTNDWAQDKLQEII